jgi:hypothetical protein
MLRALGRLGVLFLLLAACVGGFIAGERLHGESELSATTVPLPHHIPPPEGGASFRFAMAHDVLHERYPKHGPAFYTERNRLARERLKVIPPDSDEAFALTDDLAAGLDRLGKPADAVPLLREKLKLQEQRGLTGRDLYTTSANLGTFLVHAHMGNAMRGDPDAKSAVQEGLDFVEKSIAVNPNAHFGREKWQAEIIKFILKAIDHPEMLATTDCIGNRLNRTFPAKDFLPASAFRQEEGTARPYTTSRLMMGNSYITRNRTSITLVAWETEREQDGLWQKFKGVPFDEPLLGIIGMWRQGGGANPHFALCVGEVMLRVGQRHIAWSAFERASRIADRYWPDPAKQQFLRDHCARRQKQIEDNLPANEVAEFRPRFDAELAHGEWYQREYQEYEAAKIAAGADIREEHLFDDFHKTHDSIATPPGPEEYLVTTRVDYVSQKMAGVAGSVFAAGVAAVVISVAWPRRK